MSLLTQRTEISSIYCIWLFSQVCNKMLGATTYPQEIVLYKKIIRIASILVFTLMPFYLTGQDTSGTISGTVTDPQGASIAGAAVQVTNTGTGATAKLVTNASGYYEAPLLLPGGYSVSVESSGFRESLLRSGITLGIGEQLQINVPLEVGGTTESVTITAEAPHARYQQRQHGTGDDQPRSDGSSSAREQRHDADQGGSRRLQVPGTTQFLVQGQVGGGSGYYAPGNVGGNE